MALPVQKPLGYVSFFETLVRIGGLLRDSLSEHVCIAFRFFVLRNNLLGTNSHINQCQLNNNNDQQNCL